MACKDLLLKATVFHLPVILWCFSHGDNNILRAQPISVTQTIMREQHVDVYLTDLEVIMTLEMLS